MNKAAGIIIKDKSLLILRSKNKRMFFAPGGKLDKAETPEEALIRELKEEININVGINDISFYGTFSAPAAGIENIMLTMMVFWIDSFTGEITPNSEIEEIFRVNSTNINLIELSSIFYNDVFVPLQNKGYIL